MWKPHFCRGRAGIFCPSHLPGLRCITWKVTLVTLKTSPFSLNFQRALKQQPMVVETLIPPNPNASKNTLMTFSFFHFSIDPNRDFSLLRSSLKGIFQSWCNKTEYMGVFSLINTCCLSSSIICRVIHTLSFLKENWICSYKKILP